MTILTVDRGNSSFKLGVWDECNLLHKERITDFNAGIVEKLSKEYGIEGCAWCVSGEFNEQDILTISRLFNGNVKRLSWDSPLPLNLSKGYQGPIGADRIAAMIGAKSLYPDQDLIVVDAGTALTIDILDKDACFKGGIISPGINMRLQSLHEFTCGLPFVSPDGNTPSLGHETETAIRSGVINGVSYEIDSYMHLAFEKYGVKRMVATGGDIKLILERTTPCLPVTFDEDLVGRGLNGYYRWTATAAQTLFSMHKPKLSANWL